MTPEPNVCCFCGVRDLKPNVAESGHTCATRERIEGLVQRVRNIVEELAQLIDPSDVEWAELTQIYREDFREDLQGLGTATWNIPVLDVLADRDDAFGDDDAE